MCKYRVIQDLGWVDFDLGSSPGWWAATVATYCPSRMVEYPNLSQPNPAARPPAPPCMVPDANVPEAADRDGVEYNGAGNEYDCVR